MQEARIVIGANFGDEGKGLMTDVYAREMMKKYGRCLVSCTNGGSQKGHTVVDEKGRRHVFHHFGSGSMNGADTYLAKYFIVNPIIFNKEYQELLEKGICTRTYIDENCLITLPFDMMINQLIEEKRGSKKHGSCGFGIFETLIRSGELGVAAKAVRVTVKDLIKGLTDGCFYEMFEGIEAYIRYRLKVLGIEKEMVSEKWQIIIEDMENQSRDILEAFYEDLMLMLDRVTVTDENILDKYEGVVFEASQGLLLDKNNTEYMPHLTPSNTGVKNPARIIRRYVEHSLYSKSEGLYSIDGSYNIDGLYSIDGINDIDIEICYVTRSYITRHGAGRFDEECKKSEINPDMYDKTNIPNPFQDTLRYGRLNIDSLHERIEKDLLDFERYTGESGCKASKTLAITHLNEYMVDMDKVRCIFNDYNIVEKAREL